MMPQNCGLHTDLVSAERSRRALRLVLCSLVVSALTMAGAALSAAQCLTAPDGLVTWYSANGNAMDRQGANDGAFSVPILYTAGQVGEAFQFVGGDGNVVEASDASLPKDREPRTIEFWIQTTESVDRTILGYGTTQNRQVVRVGLRDGRVSLSQLERTVRTDNPVNDGRFHHVAIVYEGGNDQVRFYLDGHSDESNKITLDTRLSGRLIIGADEKAEDPVTAVVDELSIYNRALSQSEVKAIFDAGADGKCKRAPGEVQGVDLALVICHNLTTGLSAVMPATAGVTTWNCAESGLTMEAGDWIHQELIGIVK